MIPFDTDIIPGASGPVVANLQSALLLLIDRRRIAGPSAPDLRKGIVAEQSQNPPQFGDATRRAVQQFQQQQRLADNLDGIVESSTAKRLNTLLQFDVEWHVTGIVRDARGTPSAGTRVAVFTTAGGHASQQPIAEVATSSAGAFDLAFVPAEKGWRDAGSLPRLFARALAADQHVIGTSSTETLRELQFITRLDIVLDAAASAGGTGGFVVHGTITFQGPPPDGDLTVVAFDRDLRTRQKLGQATTIRDYSIAYSPDTAMIAERGGADVMIEVRDRDDVVIATSDTVFNAPANLTIDVTVPGQQIVMSEFELVVADVVPLLAGQGPDHRDLTLAELTNEDLSFIVSETGRALEQISALVAAAQAARVGAPAAAAPSLIRVAAAAQTTTHSSVSSDMPLPVPVDAYYGWFREGISSDPATFASERIVTLRTTLLRAIDDDIVPAALKDRVEDILLHVPNTARDALHQLIGSAGLPESVAIAVAPAIDSISGLTSRRLRALVDGKTVSQDQAQALGLATTVSNLGGWDVGVVSRFLTHSFATLPRGTPTSARDLALLDVADWRSAIDALSLPVPAGTTPDAFARSLALNAVARFPNTALFGRTARIPANTASQLATLQPLLELNADGNALAQPFDSLKTDGLPPDGIQALRDAFAAVRATANLNPGLGLVQLLSAPGDASAAIAATNQRIGWMTTVQSLNPTFDFLDADFTPESADLAAINFGSLADDAKRAVIANLKAAQRAYAVTDNALAAVELMGAGYSNAASVARATTRQLIAQTGQPQSEVVTYQAKAKKILGTVAQYVSGIQDIIHNKNHTPIPSLPDDDSFFAKLPGFADMFGDQTICNCCDCQSIFGPAAYFVDLMYYIEKNILDGSFPTTPFPPLHLKSRRPDLWDLELSCDNTDTIVATLDIVNEILESYIVAEKGLAGAPALYAKLAEAPTYPQTGYFGDPSFSQPFAFAADRLEELLGHFALRRYDVSRIVTSSASARARARLRLLPAAFDLVVTNRERDLQFLTVLFSYAPAINPNDPNYILSAISIGALMSRTGLDRESMEAVALTDFVDRDGPANKPVQAVVGRASAASIQNDAEVIANLTPRRLDRIHRFIRLWRRLPWTVKELDYVLSRLETLSPLSATNGFDNHLVAIVAVLDLQDQTGCSVEEAMALWDDISGVAIRGDQSLFDALFNLDAFVRQTGALPMGHWPQAAWPATYQYTHPSSGGTTNATPVTQRLLAALQITDGDLVTLIGFVRPGATKSLQISGGAATGDLATLYRCVRLSRALQVSVPAMVQALGLIPGIAPKFQANRTALSPADVATIIQFVAWQQSSGFSLDDIADLVNGTATDSTNAGALAGTIVSAVAADKSLDIAETLLTQAGFTDAASRALLAADTSLEILPSGGYRVRSSAPLQVEQTLVFDGDLLADLGMTSVQSQDVVQANTGTAEVFVAGTGAGTYALNPAFDWSARASLAFDATYLASALPVAADQTAFLANNSAASGLLVEIGASQRYVLAMGVDPTSPAATYDTTGLSGTPDDVAAKLAAMKTLLGTLVHTGACVQKLALLRQFHPVAVFLSRFASASGLDRAKATALLDVPAERMSATTTPAAAKAADFTTIGDALRGAQPPATLVPLLEDLSRLATLFKSTALSADDVEWIAGNAALFTLALGQKPTIATLKSVTGYTTLVSPADPAFYPGAPAPDVAAVREVLTKGVAAQPPATSASADAIAASLRVDLARMQALLRVMTGTTTSTLGVDAFSDLRTLQRALEIMGLLGIDGEALSLIASERYADLDRAADSVYGAFRAKYADNASFTAAMEPHDDVLRGVKRDGLVGFFLANWNPPFAEPADLYKYFLIDVQVAGCARTSRIVSATSSLQLYVNRVIMNLEQSADGTAVATFDRSQGALEEWSWRQFYRTWEANRKVTLYAESYIEPSLRDDKTPLFKELEDTLLQQGVSEQNVLDAYAAYMAGFDEVATLAVCGSYREGRDTAGDVLHLFAATAADPPIYYYRTIEGIDDHTLTDPSVRRYTPWQKLDVQIPVRRVSPIVYQGRLFVFWIEILTKPVNTVVDGTSRFTGYTHTIQLKYSYLRLDGRWVPSQRLRYIPQLGGTTDARPGLVVDDPLVIDATALSIVDTWPGVKAMQGSTEMTSAIHQIGLDVLAVANGQDNFVITYDPQTLADIQNDSNNPYDFTEHMDQYRSMVKDYVLRMRYPLILGGLQEEGAHKDPVEGYTLHGAQWDTPYPFTRAGDDALYLAFGDFREFARIDFVANTAVKSVLGVADFPNYQENLLRWEDGGPGTLLVTEGTNMEIATPQFSFATIVAGQIDPYQPRTTYDVLDAEVAAAEYGLQYDSLLIGTNLATTPIDGSLSDATIVAGADQLLMDWWPRGQGQYVLRRLGTTRGPAFSQRLFEQGFDGLLDKSYQMGPDFNETGIPVSLASGPIQFAKPNAGGAYLIDFAGPMGVYFREIFFHIPFLLANYANSQQEFSLSQTLYHHIFNPTAPVDPVNRTATSERDRPWQYREFVGLKAETLRDILGDQNVLDAYKRDPFNPHAIARLHLSIYQKSIVMKYVDNLLDWGDSLFTQFTMESINEAVMLYMMAADILGPTPLELPSCGEPDSPMTYATIQPQLDATGEFLIELENVQAGLGASLSIDEGQTYVGVAPNISTATLITRSLTFGEGGEGGDGGDGGPPGDGGPGFTPGGMGWNDGGMGLVWNDPTGTPLTQLSLGDLTSNGGPPIVGAVTNTPPTSGNIDFVQGFGPTPGQYGGAIPFPEDNGTTVVGGQQFDTVPSLRDGQFGANLQLNSKVPPKQTGGRVPNDPANLLPTRAVFCVPANEDLLGYWDRVTDRLFKIRHCMDISGAARQPDLFAPEIDPRLLVRMAAAGLTLADVLEATRGDLPPYRFQYLIDKAKQFAQTLQNLTSQGQSALEKKDAAELAQLRAVHEQNLLKMRRQAMQLDIDAAQDTADSLRLQKTAIENRRDYYRTLGATGLQPWEITQQVSRHVASGIYTVEATLGFLAGALHLVPDLGSPFAITYGGKETGDSVSAFAHAMAATAKIAEAVSSSAGLEATFQRRSEEWQHQINLAVDELNHHQKAIAAADIRVEIATQALAAHDKAIEQAEDVFNLYRDQFTGLGLFTFLSTEVYRLQRLAFNTAFGVAKMVEQAYRFERPDDSSAALLETSYWDSEHAGLLAGERLLLDLQQLERRFIETNYRTLEITQSFSLLQFAPDKLVELRETGACTFTVPEVFFDLHYPGHYNRIIKAVRLTIPSVVGPYTNVAAALRLNGGRVRSQPKPTSTPVPVPLRHTISVAASSAQNDAGVFEFGFRDERYMPFEGGGAIDSEWEVRLPNAFRAFDYRTISDVILHVSYTASEDVAYRNQVDASNGQLAAALRSLPTERLFNLRSEFPSAWAKFKDQQPSATKLAQFTTKLDARYYPFWSQSALSTVVSARLYAKTSANTVAVNTSDGSGTPDPLVTQLGALFYGDLTNNKPSSPVDTVALNLNDNSMDDLWLLIAWN